MNLIFFLVWTRFLQATQAVKIQFKVDKKSSSSNSIFQTRYFKNQLQINRLRQFQISNTSIRSKSILLCSRQSYEIYNSTLEVLGFINHNCAKGGLILKVFHFASKLQKWMPTHSSEHLFFRWIVLRGVIWHPFLEIWAKVKNFLRLSYF